MYKKLTPAVCGLFLLATLSSPLSAQAIPLPFEKSKLGESLEETIKKVKRAKFTGNPKPQTRGATCELEDVDFLTAKKKMEKCYFFRDGKLVMVKLNTNITDWLETRARMPADHGRARREEYFNNAYATLRERFGVPVRSKKNVSLTYYGWTNQDGVHVDLLAMSAFVQTVSVTFSDGSFPPYLPGKNKR